MTLRPPIVSSLALALGVALLAAPPDILERLGGVDLDARSGALEHAAALVAIALGVAGLVASRLRPRRQADATAR